MVKHASFLFQFWWTDNEACPPNCPCNQPRNWRNYNFFLTSLQELEIENFKGSGHEVDFLKAFVQMCAPGGCDLETGLQSCSKLPRMQGNPQHFQGQSSCQMPCLSQTWPGGHLYMICICLSWCFCLTIRTKCVFLSKKKLSVFSVIDNLAVMF